MIILSILCPTIPSRKKQFEDLRYKIVRQIGAMNKDHPSLGHVEFIHDDSKPFLEGGLSIGAKCNELLKRAEGKYVCYLHDDDNVAPNYVETLVRLCNQNPDVVTFRNITMLDTFWMTVDMSIHYQNEQASQAFEIHRQAWSICPVRSEFARLVKFQDINYGEDSQWMSKVLEYCSTESHTNSVLHLYNHSRNTSEADKITNHVQSIAGREIHT